MEKLVSREFRDLDHFREQLQGRDTPAIQIEPGPISIRFRRINLEKMIFSDNRVNRQLIDHSRIEAGWTYFIINLAPAIFCGSAVNDGHLTVLHTGREYRSVIASNWHAIGIMIQTSVLTEEGICLAPHHLLKTEDASVRLPVELVGIFRRLAETAFDGSDSRPIDHARLRSAILRALDKALKIGARERDTLRPHRAIGGYELTSRMIRYVDSRFGQHIGVNEIAGELNVTPRALHYAARSTLGISPLDLILTLRLNHVRNELWDMRRSEASITHAALTQDFGHLGRFSQQYRALFGELPSETLQRIRSLVD
jgi:AraC-like DNA-binding protein